MKKHFLAKTVLDYKEAASYIITLMQDFTVFTLTGNLGAGKTTLVREICQQLGATDVISSPTFSLINPYAFPGGMIYHMDMYRITLADEAIDFGIEEYLWDGHFCFIEWPEIIIPLLPEPHVRITIELQADQSRNILVEFNSSGE